ncbi:MAG: alpha/beta hydrolase [Candidatus Neomarinimicrobiota bacterium]
MRKIYSSIIILVVPLLLLFVGCGGLLDPDEPGNLVPKTVDEGNVEHANHAVEINGTILHIETYGDPSNPVIIFLHGGPVDDFRSLLRLNGLQDDYYCVFYDQRGGGLSRRHDPDDISIESYIGDLDAIIEKYRRTPTDTINFIAHSWGAQIVTFYIDDDPQRALQKVDKVVYSDPGPWKDEWMDYVMVDLDLTAGWMNEFMWNNEFISSDTHERADYWAFVTKGSNPDRHLSKADPSPKWRWGAYATYKFREDAADGWDWTTNLSQFTNKVLFIRSGLNEDHTPEYFDLVMEPYPVDSLVTIENVGHDLCWVKSVEYMDVVRSYFEE